MRRRLSTIALFSMASLGGLACGGSGGGEPPPYATGAESFESPPPGGSNQTRTLNDSPTAGGEANASSGDQSASRTVEEADVYKLVDSTLYVLNAYRGLQIVDLSDLQNPRLLSRVPVIGTPIDLYVRGTTAFVVVNDYFNYVAMADGALRPQRGSRLFTIDVSVPSKPVIRSELPIDGQVEQTRLVGEVLYIVSRQFSWYDWTVSIPRTDATAATSSIMPGPDSVSVASFHITQTDPPTPVDHLELPANGWNTHANVTDQRITLSFAGWENGNQGIDSPTTRFQIVDISDPGGTMKAGAVFSTQGSVQDRWGMDFDAEKGLFRAVVAKGWNSGATLEVWSSSDPGTVEWLSRLDILIAESLTAARFDGSRVYVVTALKSDPLWTIDTTDPKHPKPGGMLKMEGQLEYLEPRGDRLVALGHTPENGQQFQLQVSLINVANFDNPQLLSRAIFGPSWGGVSASADDLRKAFLVLEPSPEGMALVLVPMQGWDQHSGKPMSGTQLVVWDQNGNNGNDTAKGTVTTQGFLDHPGAIKRSFPFNQPPDRLIALSDSSLQTIAVEAAAGKWLLKELARLELARTVQTLALVGGKVVELSSNWWYNEPMELVVTDALDPDSVSPLARKSIGAPYAQMFPDGNVIWLLAHDWSTNQAWLQAFDFTDPLHPVSRGRLNLLPAEAADLYPGGWSWGFGNEAVLVGHALAIHRGSGRSFERGADRALIQGDVATQNEVRVYDLTNPDNPRFAASVPLTGSAWSWGLQAAGNFLWLTHFEWQPTASKGRYYVDRIDLSDPSNPKPLAKINVPGIFFGASADGRRLYTVDSWWKENLTTTWMHGLLLTDQGTARLYGSAALTGYPNGVALNNGFAWIVTAVNGMNTQPYSRLSAVDLGKMRVTSGQTVNGDWAWLRHAAGGKLFLQASWQDQGLLIYGLGNPALPAFERFVRTPSWVWDIVVGGGYAYLPSGPYGVPMVKLAEP